MNRCKATFSLKAIKEKVFFEMQLFEKVSKDVRQVLDLVY